MIRPYSLLPKRMSVAAATAALMCYYSFAHAATFVSDTYAGSGMGRFHFHGRWEHVRSMRDGRFLGTSSRSATFGSSVSLSFVGEIVRVYGVRGPGGGRGMLTIDGRRYPDVDFYSPTKNPHAVIFSSPVLYRGVHAITITANGDDRAKGHRSGYVNLSGAVYL